MGQKGATLWFTGLSASGKSTIAVAVEQVLLNPWTSRLPSRWRQHPYGFE